MVLTRAQRHGDTASRLYKNLMVLLSGTALAQLVNILASPILSRLYSPEAFGIFGLYSAVSMILSISSTLRYDVAIVLPGEDEDAKDLVRLSVICVLSVALAIVFGLGGVRAGAAVARVSLGEQWAWLWFVPLVVLARGAHMIATGWAMRRSFFHHITTSRVSQPIVSTAVQILAGMLGIGAVGFVGGQCVGQMVASVLLIALIAKHSTVSNWLDFDSDRLRRVARNYGQFPKYSLPQAFISLVSQYIPVFVFARFFDNAFLGYYTLTSRVIQLPLTVVGQAVSDSFLPQLAESYRQGRAYEELRRMVGVLSVVGFIPALIVVPLAPSLFAWAFGPEWRVAGSYAQIVAPHALTSFVIPPVSNAMQVLNQQRWYARFEAVQGAFAILATLIGGFAHEPTFALGLYTAVGVVAHFMLIAKALRVARNRTTGE